jgi:hypothetical protein
MHVMIKSQSHRENGSGAVAAGVAPGLRGSRMICATFAASMSTGAPLVPDLNENPAGISIA